MADPATLLASQAEVLNFKLMDMLRTLQAWRRAERDGIIKVKSRRSLSMTMGATSAIHVCILAFPWHKPQQKREEETCSSKKEGIEKGTSNKVISDTDSETIQDIYIYI